MNESIIKFVWFFSLFDVDIHSIWYDCCFSGVYFWPENQIVSGCPRYPYELIVKVKEKLNGPVHMHIIDRTVPKERMLSMNYFETQIVTISCKLETHSWGWLMDVNYLDSLFKQNSSGLRKLINEAWENDVGAWVRMH